jgi:EAL domain-containing protein (putative c-di-GMP-specific phosphodiesterase class I)
VNVTAHYLASADLIDTIKSILNETGLKGDSLELEITENVLIYDIEPTREKLVALQQLGVKIAIDDFGTGYSSFNYLKRFAFDHIKIDQSFIRDMHSSSSDLAIVKAIIATGKSFNAKLIAEGVETPAQERILTLLGCDEIQGFQYCRPNTAEVITQFFQKHF